ncbi:MAG: TetR family transcriptional regulator [Actinobacteria bacterium]|nr:TetR family transcriptional regulator [Actinomycetota bacterium]MBO0835582.1 TetR family transcriptional regulator [Actinomycetota bacterium]
MRQAEPAIPSTAAQHGRHDRILAAATAMLAAGGEDALQMKDLSQRAGVSLATLYRYFPAKDHVLLGILLNRYSAALARITAEVAPGATARERVTSHLLREFRAQQREPRLTAALGRVISETKRSYSEVIEQVERLHLQMLEHVAGAGQPISPEQRQLLPVVQAIFGTATRRWLTGVYSPAKARLEIRLGCRLLDLPDSAVAEDEALADKRPSRG